MEYMIAREHPVPNMNPKHSPNNAAGPIPIISCSLFVCRPYTATVKLVSVRVTGR